MYVTECGRFEVYLWMGNKVKIPLQKEAKSYAHQLATSRSRLPAATAVVLHSGMETIMFKEKFAHVHEAFSRVSHATQEVKKKLPSMDVEIKRMTSNMFGTLKMVGSGVGDMARSGMVMGLADDPSGELFVWKVSKPTRKLVEVDPLYQSFFFDDSAYAVLYCCKNGSRKMIFLWIGKRCANDVQAALALQCRSLEAASGADQIHVPQGRESPLFLAIFSKKCGNPFTVINESICAQLGAAVEEIVSIRYVIELANNPVLLPNQAAIAIQINASFQCSPKVSAASLSSYLKDLSAHTDSSISPYRSRVAIALDFKTGECNAILFTGIYAPQEVTNAARQIIDNARRIGYLLLQKLNLTRRSSNDSTAQNGGLVVFDYSMISSAMSRYSNMRVDVSISTDFCTLLRYY
jgi:hypothetical protein